jgi:hypothetical protein
MVVLKVGVFSKLGVWLECPKTPNFSTSTQFEHLRVGSIRIVVLLIRQVTHVLAIPSNGRRGCTTKLANYQLRNSTLNRTKTDAKRRFLQLPGRIQAVKTSGKGVQVAQPAGPLSH